MRYVWDQFDTYFRQPRTSMLVRIGAEATRSYLQHWDRKHQKGLILSYATVRTYAAKIRDYYNRESQVVHPPVDLSFFKPGKAKESYYLMVGAFAPNKRVDLAVKAFNQLKLPLKLPEEDRMKHTAGLLQKRTLNFMAHSQTKNC